MIKTIIDWGGKPYLIELTEKNLYLQNIKENIYKGNTIFYDNKKEKLTLNKNEKAIYIYYNDIYIISRILDDNSILEDVINEACNIELDRIENFLNDVIDITEKNIHEVFKKEREKNRIENEKREKEREMVRIEKRRKEEKEKERKIEMIEEDIINGDYIDNENLILIADKLQVAIPIRTRGFIKNKLSWIKEGRYISKAGSKSEKVFEIYDKVKREVFRLKKLEC